MRALGLLVLFHTLSTALQVYLIFKISTIGKIGIALFYHEYRVFRSGPKTFALFFSIQLALVIILFLISKYGSRKLIITSTIVLILTAVAGLIYTYNDFMYTYSHRLLKERFHLGFYLFWIGIIVTAMFFLRKTPSTVTPKSSEQQANANERQGG
jgi:hypothetical protein